MGQTIEQQLRSPTYLRAPQTQTMSRVLKGGLVRVSGRDIGTNSALQKSKSHNPLKVAAVFQEYEKHTM